MTTVYTTTDYSIFKKLEGNRTVKQKRINAITESVSAVGWVTNPIIVNENMEIIDGQGRLEVLKSMNLPVDYVIQAGAGLKECQEINLHTMIWTSEEMIRWKASRLLTELFTTDLKPSTWMVISGVMATSATTPKAEASTLSSPFIATQAPIASGRMKLEVSGPDATPPESKAIEV